MGPRRQSIEFSRLSVWSTGTGDRKTLSGRGARLLVHFRCLYATAVEERPPGWRVEPSSLTRVGVSLLVCARSRFNRSCQRVPAFALGLAAPGGCMWMTSLLGSAAAAGNCGSFNVAHCRFGGE
jgi:hypothetical protein